MLRLTGRMDAVVCDCYSTAVVLQLSTAKIIQRNLCDGLLNKVMPVHSMRVRYRKCNCVLIRCC